MPWKEKWISDTSRDWDRKLEGTREHITIDVSFKGVSGRDAACGWAVVRLDYDTEEEAPWYSFFDTKEVHRTINRSERCAFADMNCPSASHTDSIGIIDGLWRGRRKMYWTDTVGC